MSGGLDPTERLTYSSDGFWTETHMATGFLHPSVKKRVPIVLALVMTVFFFVLASYRLDLGDSSFLTSLDLAWIDAKFRMRGPLIPGD